MILRWRRALRAARLGPLDAGGLASLLALALHNVVDFNWQIPANAATFVAVAALASRRGEPEVAGWGSIALTPRGGPPKIGHPPTR